jgi:hypothetical protein
VEAAVKSFTNGPLSRPTEALVRSFVLILVKAVVSGDIDEPSQRRHYAAINAVRQIHRPVTEKTLNEKVNDIFKSLPDNRFGLIMRFLHFVPDTWQYIRDDVRTRMVTYVKDMPAQDLVPNLLVALKIENLQTVARMRLSQIPFHELGELFEADSSGQFTNEFYDITIDPYEKSASYSQANQIGYALLNLIEFLSPDQINRIIKAGQNNDQVENSHTFKYILSKIVDSGKIDKKKMIERLNEYGLDHLIRSIPELKEDDYEIPF